MRCLFIHEGPCPVLNVSYKPQKISPKSQGTVRQLLHDRIRDAYVHPQFVADVMKPLLIDNIIDQEVIRPAFYTGLDKQKKFSVIL